MGWVLVGNSCFKEKNFLFLLSTSHVIFVFIVRYRTQIQYKLLKATIKARTLTF